MSAPLVRRSSNGKDTTPSSVEMAVRLRPRRSIVRSLDVREVPPRIVAPLIVQEHYLHSMPPAAVVSFGVYSDTNLVGAVVVTSGARNAHHLLVGSRPGDVATLARLWLADAIPKNAESRVLGIVVRLCRKRGNVRALLTYADPAAGHTGTIYRAAGWRYLGRSQPGRYVDLGDGRPRHPRSVYSAHGTNSPWRLRVNGLSARSVRVEGKHRYCMVVDRSWAWRLGPPIDGEQ